MKNPMHELKKNLRYVDIPELNEIYADCLGLSTFDGNSLRLEFCVSRMDDPKPPAKPTGRTYPVCRLVLSPDAAEDLVNRLQMLVTAIAQQAAANIGPNPFPEKKAQH